MKRPAVLLTLTLLALSTGLACSGRGGDPAAETRPKGTSPAAPASLAPVASALPASAWAPPGFKGSVYDLELTLTGHEAKPMPLDVFRGHPLMITMFYGSCPNACPLLTSDIKRIEKLLPAAAKARVRVLMVSFDAPRDTPEKLTQFMTEHGLDAARFKLASAPEDSARELAAVLGIRYRKLETGAYFHTSAIILLDENGQFLARVEGLGKDPAPILAALH